MNASAAEDNRPEESAPQDLTSAANPEPEMGKGRNLWRVMLPVFTFLFGLGSGYLLGVVSPFSAGQASMPPTTARNATEVINQINPPDGYTLPVSFGVLGPQLVAVGAIDFDRFEKLYEQKGKPLTQAQRAVLTEGGDASIVINRENADFLLNLLWALGLTNQNALLEEGLMVQYSQGEIGRYASTGGWTLGTRPAVDLYASQLLIPLTEAQQARLVEVASAVYRPCCDNPTSFPDCNHGMAMLGLLELMAAQDASTEEMFAAAKYLNAFWFPQQTMELALYFQDTQGLDFSAVDARDVVGINHASGSGFQTVHRWLAEHGLLEQAPGGGQSCGV